MDNVAQNPTKIAIWAKSKEGMKKWFNKNGWEMDKLHKFTFEGKNQLFLHLALSKAYTLLNILTLVMLSCIHFVEI